MRTATILPAILLAVTCLSARAQDVATLKVEGRGAEGRPAYRGGGVVKFLNISLGAQVKRLQSSATSRQDSDALNCLLLSMLTPQIGSLGIVQFGAAPWTETNRAAFPRSCSKPA